LLESYLSNKKMLPDILKNNLSIPVVAAPLFIISRPNLVIAQCKAGVVGSFPALNARPQELLSDWIKEIKDELGEYQEQNPGKKVAPFAVNQICHLSNDRLLADVETCVKHEVPIIITSLRPPADLVKAIHSYGGLVFHDVINTRHAQKAVSEGVDGLILVCAGAGGHAGALSPFALLRETREWYDGTILLSGAISDGYSVASALAMGADLAYIGTRFISTQESEAEDEYKQMLIDSSAKDVVYTNYFSGVHGNYLSPSVIKSGMDPDNLPEADKTKMNFNSGGNAAKKVWKDIKGCGQGLSPIKDSPAVADLVDNMKKEFADASKAFTSKSSVY
jgi:nitronate monooxygenase